MGMSSNLHRSGHCRRGGQVRVCRCMRMCPRAGRGPGCLGLARGSAPLTLNAVKRSSRLSTSSSTLSPTRMFSALWHKGTQHRALESAVRRWRDEGHRRKAPHPLLLAKPQEAPPSPPEPPETHQPCHAVRPHPNPAPARPRHPPGHVRQEQGGSRAAGPRVADDERHGRRRGRHAAAAPQQRP